MRAGQGRDAALGSVLSATLSDRGSRVPHGVSSCIKSLSRAHSENTVTLSAVARTLRDLYPNHGQTSKPQNQRHRRALRGSVGSAHVPARRWLSREVLGSAEEGAGGFPLRIEGLRNGGREVPGRAAESSIELDKKQVATTL